VSCSTSPASSSAESIDVGAGRSRLAFDAAQKVRSQNCERPHVRGGGAAELVQPLEHAKTGVLGQVFRFGRVPGQTQRHPVEIVEMHEHVGLESANPVAGSLLA
jgi:hypothetical protein